ncbi:MAG: LysE family transporter [Spirochaetales bacterium]|nr:LysE family transporter [Spirochaetales bacterium]
MAALFSLVGISFINGLTGAALPGPLFSYTVVKTLDTPRRGWLTGPRVIIGHAVVEITLIVLILLGLSVILSHPVAKAVGGFLGAFFLFFLAFLIMKDVVMKKAFLPTTNSPAEATRTARIKNPYLAGALISALTPLWWLWWVSIGIMFMNGQFISLTNLPSVGAFVIGHLLADFAWYFLVSLVIHNIRRFINHVVYRVILIIAAGLMGGYGIFTLVTAILAVV